MEMNRLMSKTQRELPADADTVSQQLLHRAGYLRQLGAGMFSLLPLGLKTLKGLERIIRNEMEALGAQEISMPIVHPAELWQLSGRWESVDQELLRFKDRLGRYYCLAMTHEEVVTQLAAQFVSSYKQLPFAVYQFQTKFRDEPRPRGGLIRAREFLMKDAYSFHETATDFAEFYSQMLKAYERIFEHAGLEIMTVASDTGLMGGAGAHEFMYLNPRGEDTLILCNSCGYKANRQVAQFKKVFENTEPLPLEEVATPEVATIEALAEYLNISEAKTAKAVFLVDEGGVEERLIFAVIRGDLEVNETKLATVVGAKRFRQARVDEIIAIGAEPGYASPMGIKRKNVLVVCDDTVAQSTNLVAGANKVGFHLLNTNYGRDYSADRVADIAAAKSGDTCNVCDARLSEERGIEVGNIFDLGTTYSEVFDASFLSKDGYKQTLHMGCYGIGVGRLLACIVEAHHDEEGIAWPKSVAPFDLSLIVLKDKQSNEPFEVATKLYQTLKQKGIEVLFDNRDENPGVKFKDADLIGLPLHLTVGKRGLERGMVEFKNRQTGQKWECTLENALESVLAWEPG